MIARSIVRDLHSHEQAARLLARMMIVFSFVPIGAPIDRRASSLSAAAGAPSSGPTPPVAAVLLVAVSGGSARNRARERRSARPGAIARTFADIARRAPLRRADPAFSLLPDRHPRLGGELVLHACRGLGVSVTAYGWMFAGVMIGQITGAWAASRFVLRLGIGAAAARRRVDRRRGRLAAAGFAWAGREHWAAMVVPFAVLLFGTALVLPNATALALSPFPHAAGAASSLIGAIGFTARRAAQHLLGALFDGTARPMASVAALAGLAAFIFEAAAAWTELDAVVVGAGVVGLAVARELALAGREVVVLEAEDAHRHAHQLAQLRGHPRRHLLPARARSRRAPASPGERLLYAYCATHGVPHRRCGKLIVATDAAQLERAGRDPAQARMPTA